MPFLSSIPWWLYALAGALFAGATNVFIKAGMKGVDSNLATAMRTLFALPMLWCIAAFTSRVSEVSRWTALNWLFIGLSAIASGLSWLCAYKSIDMAGVARTLPIDKSSIAFGVILAVIFLRERPPWQSIIATLLVLAAPLGVTLIPSKASGAPASSPASLAETTAKP